jgi:hypothetical protein
MDRAAANSLRALRAGRKTADVMVSSRRRRAHTLSLCTPGRRSRRAIVLLLALAVPASAEVDNGALSRTGADLAAAANRFYATYAAIPRSGGIPGPAARARLAPLLSSRLAGMINAAAAAEARFHAKVKQAPPLIEGDLFSSQFEGFQSYRVGACTAASAAGRCTVQLHYQSPGLPSGSGARGQTNSQPVDWNDEILFIKAGGQWKVDDIAYKGAFAFGNTGLLSQTLAMVVRSAP